MKDRRFWRSVFLPAFLLLLLAALGQLIVRGSGFNLLTSLLVISSALLYLRRLARHWEAIGDALRELRRFRRLIWLLPGLFLLVSLYQIAASGSRSDWLIIGMELAALCAALFTLLTLLLQFVRLSPDLAGKKLRVAIGLSAFCVLSFSALVGELQLLIYFFLAVWMFSFDDCLQISAKEKRRLLLSCAFAFLFLLIISIETAPEISYGAAAPPAQTGSAFFIRIAPISPALLYGLKRVLAALLIVLPGKVLLRPLADWLKLSLRIRTKLLLSYVLSGIIPGLLLVVLLFFGILFLLGGYYQRFITQLISAKAEAMALLLDEDSPAVAQRLKARSVSALWYNVAADGQVQLVHAVGAPLAAVPRADSLLYSLGEERFSGLATAGDSLCLTQWLKIGNQVVGLFQPFKYEDLVQLESQFGMGLAVLPGESVTFGAAGRHGLVTQIEPRAGSKMIRSDSPPGTQPQQGLAGLPVLVPCIRISQNGSVERGDMLFVVQLSVRSVLGNLFSREYVINRVYLIAFVILTALLGTVLVLVALMGFGLAGGITHSIGKLSKGTQQLRRGDLTVEIQVESKDELGELAGSFNLMVADLNRMLVEVKEKERLEGELDAARSIQLRLLPEKTPELPGYQIAAASLPAKQVGGDYYDFISLTSQSLALVVGDVSGKGMPAALLMANLQASLHTLMETPRSPSELVFRLNRVLHANTSPQMFATFFYGVLDTASGQVRFVNAGHNAPILCGNGRLEQLSTGGLPLGILPEAAYSEGILTLNKGELLALYSDGVVEAMNAQEQEFGEERLIRLLKDGGAGSAQAILKAVLAEVEAFAGTPQDDVTLVVIKRIQDSA